MASPRGSPLSGEHPHQRVQDQRDRARCEQDQQDGSGRPRQGPQGEQRPAGSTTSWIQRGTTTGATGTRSASGADALGRRRASAETSDAVAGIGSDRGTLAASLVAGARRGRGPTAWGTSKPCNWKYEHRHDMSETVSILFVGDVVGGIGKRTLLALLPGCATGTPPISSS